jgi:hypothetical protein
MERLGFISDFLALLTHWWAASIWTARLLVSNAGEQKAGEPVTL